MLVRSRPYGTEADFRHTNYTFGVPEGSRLLRKLQTSKRERAGQEQGRTIGMQVLNHEAGILLLHSSTTKPRRKFLKKFTHVFEHKEHVSMSLLWYFNGCYIQTRNGVALTILPPHRARARTPRVDDVGILRPERLDCAIVCLLGRTSPRCAPGCWVGAGLGTAA